CSRLDIMSPEGVLFDGRPCRQQVTLHSHFHAIPCGCKRLRYATTETQPTRPLDHLATWPPSAQYAFAQTTRWGLGWPVKGQVPGPSATAGSVGMQRMVTPRSF